MIVALNVIIKLKKYSKQALGSKESNEFVLS